MQIPDAKTDYDNTNNYMSNSDVEQVKEISENYTKNSFFYLTFKTNFKLTEN